MNRKKGVFSNFIFLLNFILLFNLSFALAQNQPHASHEDKIPNDVNNDRVYDSKDRSLFWWLFTRNKNISDQPSIEKFIADPQHTPIDIATTLRWSIYGEPTSISIDQGIGDVTNKDSISVIPLENTTYTLTATNSIGSDTAQVKVYITPRIVSFKASSQTIKSGDSSTLSWNIKGEYTRVSIDQGVGTVTKSNSAKVQPTQTTTYTLTVHYSGGSRTAQVTIHTSPKILSFIASPKVIAQGGNSTLSWEIDGEPTSVSINQDIGDVTDSTSFEISPTTTTTYTLTAANEHGSTTKTVTVSIKNVPLIEFFTTDKTFIDLSSTSLFSNIIVLEWSVTGSDPINISLSRTIEDDTDTIASSLSKRARKTERPQKSTTYTLTATNSVGTSTASVTVDVLNILGFVADPETIKFGNSTTLLWKVDGNPNSISITYTDDRGDNEIDVTGSTSYIVSPEDSIDYTLVVRKIDENNVEKTIEKTVTVTVINVPSIEDFRADKEFIIPGESVLLRWNITGDNPSVSLVKTIGDNTDTIFSSLPLQSATRLKPTATTTYTLIAENSVGTTTMTKTVEVLRIVSFTATPEFVIEGNRSVLSWDIEGNPDSISIDQGVGDVTGSTSYIVNPSARTTYTLTATRGDKTAPTKTVEVDVKEVPDITSFTVDLPLISLDDSTASKQVTLSWSITGSDPIALSLSKIVDGVADPNPVSLTAGTTSRTEDVSATTHYTLTATNPVGTAIDAVTVDVLKIISFETTPTTIESGGNSTLSWEISGEPDSVVIDQEVGDVTNLSSFVVTPEATTDYTLTATKTDGSITETVEKTVTLTVSASSGSQTSFLLNEEEIQDCSKCPKMVVNHQTNQSFAVGIKKITIEQWQACVKESFCNDYDFSNIRSTHPVTDVSLNDAFRYVEWLSQKTGNTYRLLNDPSLQYDKRNQSYTNHLEYLFINDTDLLQTSYPYLTSGFSVIREM